MVTHQLQVERRTGKVRQSETDVLPLCYATNVLHSEQLQCFSVTTTVPVGDLDSHLMRGWAGMPSVDSMVRVADNALVERCEKQKIEKKNPVLLAPCAKICVDVPATGR